MTISTDSFDELAPFQQSPPPEETLRLIPLGGLGEFGKNCMVYEYGNDMLMVDCGQQFPDSDLLGVDTVIPDLSYVFDNLERLQGVVLTHGHEDHIGALPYLYRNLDGPDIPVYASQLTLALLREKFIEACIELPEMIEIDVDRHFHAGQFDIEFIPISHSFPQSVMVALHLPIGIVLHTGDYKIDLDDAECARGLERLARYGEQRQVLVMLGDSTNIDREGHSKGEQAVREGLLPILAEAERGVILASFSSNLHRVQTVLDLAREVGRKVAICGYSLERNFSMASELGILHYNADDILTIPELRQWPAEKRLLLTTGTQGEPLSALSRLALNSFRGYRIEPGDRVILSSRIIPGNEKPIFRMLNHFYRHGAHVVTERDAMVHASGHAYRDEMRRVIDLAKPRYFLPVHGELRQLIHHRDLAVDTGLSPRDVFVLENGMQLDIRENEVVQYDTDWSGKILVDGKMIDGVEEVVLRDRRHLAEDGMISVILVINAKTHQIIGGPDIVSRGFVVVDENEELMRECKEVVVNTYAEFDVESQGELDVVKVSVRKALRRFLRQRTDRYPVILPVVIEL